MCYNTIEHKTSKAEDQKPKYTSMIDHMLHLPLFVLDFDIWLVGRVKKVDADV